MLLTIDIGNTHVVLGLFDGESLVHHWRIGTHRQDTSDECAATLRSLFELAGVDRASVSDAIISCVVPPLQPIFERTCEKLLRRTPLIVGPGIRNEDACGECCYQDSNLGDAAMHRLPTRQSPQGSV